MLEPKSFWNLRAAHTALAVLGFNFLVSTAAVTGSTGALIPGNLRVQSLKRPLAVESAQPILSWFVESEEQNQKQTAYRVLVSSSPQKLESNEGDLWDTGKIESDQTLNITYEGQPLASGTSAYWKVMTWDRDDIPSDWSESTEWRAGLRSEDWQARWIGHDTRQSEAPSAGDNQFNRARWIMHRPDLRLWSPPEERLYVKQFSLPKDVRVRAAQIHITGDDRHECLINGTPATTSNAWLQPRTRDVSDMVQAGFNEIRVIVRNDAVGPTGLIVQLAIVLEDESLVVIVTDETWQSTSTLGDNWRSRQIDAGAWVRCRSVGRYHDSPWGDVMAGGLKLPKPAYLRHNFSVGDNLQRATLYYTALGIADVYANGQLVNDSHFFNPGWTEYLRRVYYRAYDVTDLVSEGNNLIGAVLADGWYSGYVGPAATRGRYGGKTRFIAQLLLEFADGSIKTVATGPSWKGSTGQFLEADLQMGETFDASITSVDSWTEPGYDDSQWSNVTVGLDSVTPLIQADPSPPIVVAGKFPTRTVREPVPGVYVFDLGQTIAGVAELTVEGDPGQEIQLRFGERLAPDGTIYVGNLRSARATDTYVCRGDGVETWSPRFTYHGFRYVQVSGLEHAPQADALCGFALSSDTSKVGEFRCSNEMLNQLASNVYWTQRANFISIPTDCPQRDERIGWTGDAQIYVDSAPLHCDVQSFFAKWLVDLSDAQGDDGQYPMVAPLLVDMGEGGPGWADAGIICPWAMWESYEDRTALEAHYEAMKHFVEFCEKRSTEELMPPPHFNCFGDWLNVRAATPNEVIYMAYFAHSTDLLAQAARTLGYDDDAERYRELYDRIRTKFNEHYVDVEGRVQGDTQAAYALALAYDLVSDAQKDKAAQRLVELIRGRDWHLSTGFLGTKSLMPALAKIGRNDVAYRLILNETFPSWGFMIKQGGTSIWERWDGWHPDDGFNSSAMNSFSHPALGSVYQWMVENIAGIRKLEPGYKRFAVAPRPGGGLTHAKVHYDSVRGHIGAGWSIMGNMLTMDVAIPANTEADVVVPVRDDSSIAINGRPPAQSICSTDHVFEPGVLLRLGSGRYRITATKPILLEMPKRSR